MMSLKITYPEIYNLGKQYQITSTVGTDLIPLAAKGCRISGYLAAKRAYRQFLDFSSGYGCDVLGYGNRHVDLAIRRQLRTGLWHGLANDYYSRPTVTLAKRLCQVTPIVGKKKVFFSNSGAEAVEAAIKMCEARRLRECSDRDRFMFLSFKGNFHGRTKGSLSLTKSKPVQRDGFRLAQVTEYLPFPERDNRDAINDFHAYPLLETIQQANAVFIELVQGESGVNVIDRDSLRNLLTVCRENDIYVVIDEVQTGFYRTGKMFAIEHFDIEPDIVCLAKALGGGLPLGATIAKKEFDFDFGQHSNTGGGNLLACAAAHAVLDELEKLDQLKLWEKIEILTEFALEGLGMMRRIKLPTTTIRNRVIAKALENGLILIGAGDRAIRLMPPLTISKKDLRTGIEILKSAIVEENQ